jgi:hypothetical protein
LSYQGIALADGKTINVSGMEFIHMDVWTSDVQKKLETLVKTNGEKPVTKKFSCKPMDFNRYSSFSLHKSGLTVADIFQLNL